MKLFSNFLIALFYTTLSFAQKDTLVKWIVVPDSGPISIIGDLAEGSLMNDISWAWNSSIACFPQTQARKFSGHHILYALDLPAFTEMEIWLVPEDKKANFSIYAYMVGTVSENNIVPNLSSCIRCEADHKWDFKKRGQVQDHTRRIKDILAIANPYQVVIGVVGAEVLSEGKYTLFVQKKR